MGQFCVITQDGERVCKFSESFYIVLRMFIMEKHHEIKKVRNGWIRVTTKGVQSDVPFFIDPQQLATPLRVWTLSL